MNEPSDAKIEISEVVTVQLLAPDGTAMDVPFSRAEFDRLKQEAVAANTEVGEYIKKKIAKTAAADHVKLLENLTERLRNYDENAGALAGVGPRAVLEALVLGWADEEDGVDIDVVVGYDDEMLASVAFAFAGIVGTDARSAKTLEQDLQRLRERFAAAEVEIEQKTAALRAVNREASTERLETRVAEARAAERTAVAVELEALRADVARQRSEIDELRASKKKLREALERAKEGR